MTMQIHFMWINDFGAIKKEGINLSSQLIFDLKQVDRNPSRYELSIRTNPEYIADLFDNNNFPVENFGNNKRPRGPRGIIRNITGIIGKNGAGKTSILRYIKTSLPRGRESRAANDFFVYSMDEGTNRTFYIIHPESIELSVKNEAGIYFEVNEYGDHDAHKLVLTGHLSDAEYIYYSYLLDFNEEIEPWSGLTNLSTSYLMMEDRRGIQENNGIGQKEKESLLIRCNDLENLHMSEVARAIQFLTSDFGTIPFKKPEALTIEIDLSDVLYFENQKEKDDKLIRIIKAIQNEVAQENDKMEAMLKNLWLGIFLNYCVQEANHKSDKRFIHEIPPLENETSADYILRFFKSMQGNIFRKKGTEAWLARQEAIAANVSFFHDLVLDLISNRQLKAIDNSTMELKLDEKSEENFKRFSYFYLGTKSIGTYLNFKWRSLSGGEQSYLSMMSRFHSISENNLPKNLVILIDEGDVGYHPDWQRKYLYTTLDFLTRLFRGHSLQIILTANSPFISSDLPKSNLIFIEKKDKQFTVFHGKDNTRQSTFAANIHTLFSDSFYMDGILIGEFAKERINKIIDFINNKQVSVPNSDYKKTIDLIGEVALRKKLQDMWFEKFGPIEEREQLIKRLAELEQQINLKNDDQEPA